MLMIKALPTALTERTLTIQAVADIEAAIQPHDAWSSQALSGLLEQNSINLSIAINADGDDVVGYCLYQIVFEQAEILRIGTHPQYQRQGIASQLFATLDAELQACDVDSLLLEVRADNNPAIALYEQQGFTIIHRRKSYYQQPRQSVIDALIMQRGYC